MGAGERVVQEIPCSGAILATTRTNISLGRKSKHSFVMFFVLGPHLASLGGLCRMLGIEPRLTNS